MMGRGNMGKQIALAPASRPGSTGMDRAKEVANANASFMRPAAPAAPVTRMAKGGKIDGKAIRGKTKGKMC